MPRQPKAPRGGAAPDTPPVDHALHHHAPGAVQSPQPRDGAAHRIDHFGPMD